MVTTGVGYKDQSKAELLQEGINFLIHLCARAILLTAYTGAVLV